MQIFNKNRRFQVESIGVCYVQGWLFNIAHLSIWHQIRNEVDCLIDMFYCCGSRSNVLKHQCLRLFCDNWLCTFIENVCHSIIGRFIAFRASDNAAFADILKAISMARSHSRNCFVQYGYLVFIVRMDSVEFVRIWWKMGQIMCEKCAKQLKNSEEKQNSKYKTFCEIKLR